MLFSAQQIRGRGLGWHVQIKGGAGLALSEEEDPLRIS